MALDTVSNLKTAIMTWAERTDLSTIMTDVLSLTDARIRKDLAAQSVRVRDMEVVTDLAPSSGVVTLPTNFLAMKRVLALTSPVRRLEYKPQDWLDEAYPDSAEGSPSFYTIVGSSLSMFPVTSSDIRITYYAYPTPLSDDDPTNWLLTKFPDIYLYGGLVELELYTGATENVAKWLAGYRAALDGVSNAGADEAITSGTARSAGGAVW